MEELSRMLIVAKKAASGAPLVSDESKKWLTWAEYLDFVKALQEECAGNGTACLLVSVLPREAWRYCPGKSGGACLLELDGQQRPTLRAREHHAVYNMSLPWWHVAPAESLSD